MRIYRCTGTCIIGAYKLELLKISIIILIPNSQHSIALTFTFCYTQETSGICLCESVQLSHFTIKATADDIIMYSSNTLVFILYFKTMILFQCGWSLKLSGFETEMTPRHSGCTVTSFIVMWWLCEMFHVGQPNVLQQTNSARSL